MCSQINVLKKYWSKKVKKNIHPIFDSYFESLVVKSQVNREWFGQQLGNDLLIQDDNLFPQKAVVKN